MTKPRLGRLLQVRAAAEYLGISESLMRHVIDRREVEVMRHERGRLMGIYESHLDAWRARRLSPASVSSAPPAPSSAAVDEAVERLTRHYEGQAN